MIFDPQFLTSLLLSILYLPLYLLVIFTAFYIPGSILVGKRREGGFAKIITSLIVGMVLWAYQGMIFGYLGARYLTYIYLIICAIFWLKINFDKEKKIVNIIPLIKEKIKILENKSFYLILFIIAIGVFGQMHKFWLAGIFLTDGIHMLSAAGGDLLWHTALIEQLVRRFPPFEPGLAGVYVTNYHYWSNLVIAELIRVFHLPILQMQFQYVYLFVSLLLGAIVYVLGKKLNFSSYAIALFVYLQYFSSDILYFFTFVKRQTFDFSIGPLDGGVEFLENPPRAFSTIVAFCAIFFLIVWLKEKKVRDGIIAALLFGSLIGFKVHTAIPLYIGLSFLSLSAVIKRQFRLLLVPIVTAVLSLCIYLPVNSTSGGLFFLPFWMTRDFAVQPGLRLSNFELARQTYMVYNNWLQALRMDISMLLLFLLAQFGIKSIGWIATKEYIKKMDISFFVFLYSTMIAGVILGTFFYQKSGGANIFHFYLTSGFLLSIPTSFILGKLLSKNVQIKIFLVLLLFICTIPRWIYRTQNVKEYFGHASPMVSANELEAMNFVRNNTEEKDLVLVFNYGQWDSIYPYVSAFTQRDMFLSGQGILESHSIPAYKEREETKNRVLNSNNSEEVKKLLVDNNIRILYFYGKPTLPTGLKQLPLEKIFNNITVTVYRFNQTR